jgi:N-methylhydantoinase B
VQSGERKLSVVQPLCGGCGGRPHKDGIDGVDFSLGSLRNVPTETLESEMPLLITRYGLRPDSCGHGVHRGGNGVELQVRISTPHTIMTARGMERYTFRPWGVGGGTAGATGFTRLRRHGGEWEEIGQIDILHLGPGDEIHFGTQGGGGWGDPLARPLAAVQRDLLEGLISPATAHDSYGVVVVDTILDYEATEARRVRLRATGAPLPAYDFGPERDAYEAIWTDQLHQAMNLALDQYPASVRFFLRSQLVALIRAKAREGTVLPSDVPLMLGAIHGRLLMRDDADRRPAVEVVAG